MTTGRISKSSVDATHPGGKDILLWDDKVSGFGLKVTPSGTKVYLFQYRQGGRGSPVRRYTIGRHGGLTAEAARREAERLSLLVAQGADPQAIKVERARVSVDLAFKSYVDRFVDECLKVNWKSSHEGGAAHLKNYVVPIIGNKPLPDITRADIRAVLKPIRHKVATASYCFAVMRRLFRWAVSEGDLTGSPMEGMETPPAPNKRDRFLADAELKLIWQASDALAYPFGPLVRLLILTGQRREEVAGLTWSELDRAKSMWSLPAARAKNGHATQVPLSSMVLAELDALAKRSGRKEGWPRQGLLFSTTGKSSVSGYSRAKSRLDALVGKLGAKLEEPMSLEAWTFHDLRRTLATGMQRLGVRFEVTEAILNHVGGSRSGVAGIYQRHDWGPEKATALRAWSDHIAALLVDADKTNVVPLAAARA